MTLAWSRRRRRTALIVGLVALIFGPGLVELIRLSNRQRRLDRELGQLAAERERLTKERERLESDPTYVEGLIRSTFKVSKPGEYVVPLDDASTAH